MATGSSIVAGKGHVELAADDSRLVKGLIAAKAKFEQWGRGVVALGSSLARVGASMGAAILPSVALFATYEQALANLRAAANPTADQMAALRKQIEAVGRATGTDFADVTNGYAELLKAGVSLETVLGGVGDTLVRFARVSGMEMAQTATVLVDAMNVFAREGLNASQAANIMNQAADASTITLAEVAEAFAAGGATMALFNQNMRDTATAIAILGNSGIKGADAGTVLKTMMLRIATGSESAGAAIAELGITVRDTSGEMLPMAQILGNLDRAMQGRGAADRDRILADLAGDRGIRGLAVLLQAGTAGWERMQASMGTALTVEQKFVVMTDTLLGGLKKSWVAVQGVAVAIGESLHPAIAVLNRLLLPAIDLVAELIRENQGLVRAFAAVAAALLVSGGALLAIGFAATVVGSAFGTLASIAGGIAAAFAWIPTLVLWSDYLRYSVLGVTGVFRLFGVQMRDLYEPLGAIDDLFDSLVRTISGLISGTIFDEMAASIGRMWSELLDSPFGEFAKTVAMVVVGFTVLHAALLGVAGYLVYFATISWWDMWVRGVRSVMPVIEAVFSMLLRGLSYLTDFYQTLYAPLIGLGRGAIAVIRQTYTAAVAAFSQAWAATVANFRQLVSGLTETAAEAWGGIVAAFNVGDWQAVWAIIQAAAMLAWAQIVAFVEPTWNAWRDALEDTFRSAVLAIRSQFVTMWGEIKATALEALADVAAYSAAMAVGPARDALAAQAQSLRLDARVARSQANLEVGRLIAEDETEQSNVGFRREIRDERVSTANDAILRERRGALDTLTAQARDNELVAIWQATEDNADAPRLNVPRTPGDLLGQSLGNVSVMGGFGAHAMLVPGGSSATPEQRAENQRQRQIDLLIEAVERLGAIREEVAPRLT